MTNEDITQEEREELFKYLAATGTPVPEEKFNVHSFLHRVATSDDTTKVGNINEIELGNLKHPLRATKEFALISNGIIANPYFADYFIKEGEINTATSLSKEGFLIKQATTTTRQMADITKRYKKNRSWFKRKEKREEGLEGEKQE